MRDHFISTEKAESDMLACAAFLAERIASSTGHAESMNEIVPRYLERGEVDLGAELANAVEDPFSRDRLLIAVAVRCAEADDDGYALQLAEAIDDHGLRAEVFERIALLKASKGQHEKALATADSLTHPDFVLAGIAVNQAISDQAAADATLEQVDFPPAAVSALIQIATAQIAEGHHGEAAGYLDRAVEYAHEIEHSEERIRSLCDIGSAFIEARRRDRSVETFVQARDYAEALTNVHRDSFLASCSLGLLTAGSVELADRTLDLVTDKTQMASALLGFARDHWKKEEKQDAVEALEEAYEILKSQRDAETRDSRARNGLMATLATQFAVFGSSERGIEIALENKDPGEQMSALARIARVLTVAGQDDQARQTLNLISEDANRVLALIAMSDAKSGLEDAAGSITLLDEASELAETVTQFAARSSVLKEISERYVSHANHERARVVALENLSVIAQIRDESSQAASLATLADIYGTTEMELGTDEREYLTALVRASQW